MTRQPETSGAAAILGEVVAAAPDAHGNWGAIARHRRDSEPKCDACRAFATAYSREWYRVARAIPAFRDRHNALVRDSHHRQRATPEGREASNAKRRARLRAAGERARLDALHLVDEVAVRRAVNGEPTRLNRAERLDAVRQLHDRGYCYREIAERVRVAARQVHRDLTDLGLVNTQGEVA